MLFMYVYVYKTICDSWLVFYIGINVLRQKWKNKIERNKKKHTRNIKILRTEGLFRITLDQTQKPEIPSKHSSKCDKSLKKNNNKSEFGVFFVKT